MPSMSMVACGGTLFHLGDRVVCEDPTYDGIHKTVSGEIIDFHVDPFTKDKTLAVLKRDDGFNNGGGPHGE